MPGSDVPLNTWACDGRISIGISSCQKIVPDPENMAECFEQSFLELEQGINQPDIEAIDNEQFGENTGQQQAEDPLKAFREASEALDKAIDSLED